MNEGVEGGSGVRGRIEKVNPADESVWGPGEGRRGPMGRVTLAPSATAHEGGSLDGARQSRRAKERMVFIEWRTVRNESRVRLADPAGRPKGTGESRGFHGPWKKKNGRE